VLIAGLNPVRAYLADEGLARLCTEDYKQPNPQNMKNMFSHLTNFSLNKESDKYIEPGEEFMSDGSGNKRLLATTWKTMEAQGLDIAEI
jgi:hypothetical protein